MIYLRERPKTLANQFTKNAYFDCDRSSTNDIFEKRKICSDEENVDSGGVLLSEQSDNRTGTLLLSDKSKKKWAMQDSNLRPAD